MKIPKRFQKIDKSARTAADPFNLSNNKKFKDTARQLYDPFGIDPTSELLFGKADKPDYSKYEEEQRKALEEGQATTDEFVNGGSAKYEKGDDLSFEQLGRSEMNNIKTDQKYKDAELAALADLEDQSKNGFTAADRADMARVESNVNRANRGRLGAIQQNMQARGMSGSGMDLVAQMQSSQDANEIAALQALEQEGMMQKRKQDATSRMGGLSSDLQNRDWGQQANVAQANDFISRFNNTNSNNANQLNWGRGNQVSDNNAQSQYQFSKDRLGAKTGQIDTNFNVSADAENSKRLQDQQDQTAAGNKLGAVIGLVGGVLGAKYGGAQGAQAGYQVGSGAGGVLGQNAYRNGVYRSDEKCKENINKEHPLEIEAFLESIEPKNYDYVGGEKGKHGVVAQDLERSNIGRGIVVTDEEGMKNISIPDAISALFEAVAHLNKKK